MDILRKYVIAGLIPLSVTLLLWLLRDDLTSGNFSLTYLLVVLASAIYQGMGPSLCMAFVSFLCFNFFLSVNPPIGHLLYNPFSISGLRI
jgi:K+-sensing histidine kinase KdpD